MRMDGWEMVYVGKVGKGQTMWKMGMAPLMVREARNELAGNEEQKALIRALMRRAVFLVI
jgi:hypothetical protein